MLLNDGMIARYDEIIERRKKESASGKFHKEDF